MASRAAVHISPIPSSPKSATENLEEGSAADPGGPELAPRDMVLGGGNPPGREAMGAFSLARPPESSAGDPFPTHSAGS